MRLMLHTINTTADIGFPSVSVFWVIIPLFPETCLQCFPDFLNERTDDLQFQPLKRQTKIAADDILIFYFYLSKKIRLDFSCESSAKQRVHLKHQVLFSLKNNEKIFMNVVCCSRDWRFKGSVPFNGCSSQTEGRKGDNESLCEIYLIYG